MTELILPGSSPNDLFDDATSLLDWELQPPQVKSEVQRGARLEVGWYSGGYMNVGFNCLFRHALDSRISGKVCIVSITKNMTCNSYTYRQVASAVAGVINFLRSKDLASTSQCVIVGPASLATTVAMLTCASLGITHLVMFETLSKDSFDEKINIFAPDFVLFTSLNGLSSAFSSSKIPAFVIDQNNESLSVVVLNETNKTRASISMNSGFDFEKLNLKSFPSTHPLFALFTSGSTGKPKYILHGSAGYLIYSILSARHYLGITDERSICVLSDAGWINGHTYAVYSPLAIGATTILCESPATFCNPLQVIQLLRLIKIDILYIPVTMCRFLMSYWDRINDQDREFVKSYGLYRIGTMGEMLSQSVGEWFLDAFQPRIKNIMNSYFQTETGGIMSANIASYEDIHDPTSCGTQIFEGLISIIDPPLLDADYKSLPELVAKRPWPGIMLEAIRSGESVLGDYFDLEGNFKFFDTGYYKNGKLHVGGRSDDVINVAGHRYSTHEIESTLISLPYISEVAAVGYRPTRDSTESLAIFFSAVPNCTLPKDVCIRIQELIANRFDRTAVPKILRIEAELIKTKSGKILRRLYRDVLEQKPLGDLSTCLKPELVNIFLESFTNV